MNPINIQLYQQVKDTTGTATTVAEIIETIAGRTGASGNIEQRIILVRKYKAAVEATEKQFAADPEEKTGTWSEYLKQNKANYEEYKQGLPAVTWSGTFSKRSAKALLQYSGLICIDIDKLTTAELKRIGTLIKADKHTFLMFVSPSGNGLKVIFKVAGAADQHREYFTAIEKYFVEQYNIVIDTSGKDVSRLCFLSYHSNLVHNPNSEAFALPAAIKEIPASDQKKLSKFSTAEKQILQTGGTQINDIWESTQQVIQYTEGNRNNFIYKFACNCNRVGFTQLECEYFATGAAHDVSPTQVKATVNSAYKSNAHEHAKFKRTEKPAAANKSAAKGGNTKSTAGNKQDQQPPADSIKPDFIFWKEIKIEKGKGEEKYTVTVYKLDRADFCDYLTATGFHLLQTGDSEGFQLVHSSNGIIKPQTPQNIKHFVLAWCRKFALRHIENLLRDGQTKYFAKNELDSLPYKEVPIKRDTESETFFYFSNCYVVIDNKGNVAEHEYSRLESYIWESNKIKFEYKPVKVITFNGNDELLPYDQINCEFARFIALASYNPNNDEEKQFTRQQVTDRFLSFCSAIGFMLDGYKHPSKRKAIFAIDHKISERGEAHGRTGKSMIPQACALLKRVATISGKTYDPKYQFADEMITVDTQIINYNDMPRNFDVEAIFEKIADPYSVNRRNQGFIHFTYTNSPKVYYNTNFIPKGEGESYKARMHVIEFSDYFNGSFTPYDEFGHGLLDESWGPDEWQRFYNFMLWCVSYYKEAGLMEYPSPNIEARKLVNDVVPEFVDFMDDESYVPKNTRLKKIDTMTIFNDKVYVPCYNKRLSAHSFTGWLKRFCSSKGYQLNPLQKGKHDKSNSIEYITIGTAKIEGEQTKLL